MQILKRAALFSAAAMAIGAAPVLSQTVSYTTAGAFTGTGCAGTSCTEGTFTLSFVGNVGPNAYLSGSQIDLGSFQVQCNNAPATCPMASHLCGHDSTPRLVNGPPKVHPEITLPYPFPIALNWADLED